MDQAPTQGLDDILSPPILGDELGWIGHYKIVKVLGRGGMGMVFQAEDTRLQRPVAIKIMLPEVASRQGAKERFLREARAIAALRNEHVITIYDVNQEREIPYLAMEFLFGQSLERLLDTGTKFSVADTLRIGREIASGLAAAHEAHLIHRDIKPGNIWMEAKDSADPAQGRVRILDFGLVRQTQTGANNLTQTGNIVGTPHYMSPEQARGLNVDERADLFSLGIVLYQLCTGRLPFPADSLMGLLTALAVDTPPSVAALNGDVPAKLAELIGRLLEKDPAQRPASAREVVDAIRAIEAQATPCQLEVTKNLRKPVALRSLTAPVRRVTRRHVGYAALCALLFGLAPLGLYRFFLNGAPIADGPPVRIGVLHSRSGTMEISERAVIDAVLFAVEEINARGGVLGRPIEAIVEDCESDEQVFAEKAEKLITEDKVVTLFGCWTSASRKMVKPVVEKHQHLLMYPVSYEGMELSPNIVYLGAVPNQQVIPALRWSYGFLEHRRWYLVGSDYVFPHAVNEVIKDATKNLGGNIVGERYVVLGSGDMADIVKDIVLTKPDLILNTLNGDSNVAFFRALRRAGVRSDRTPTLSFSVSEEELASRLQVKEYAGDYVAGNYLESQESPKNAAFLKAFRARFGSERQVSDAMQTAYSGVYLWAQAVAQSGSVDPLAIREALRGQRIEAPQGHVEIDPTTLHLIQQVRVGKLLANGSTEETFVTPQPVRPEPYPTTRPREAWDAYLTSLFEKWGGRWSNAQ